MATAAEVEAALVEETEAEEDLAVETVEVRPVPLAPHLTEIVETDISVCLHRIRAERRRLWLWVKRRSWRLRRRLAVSTLPFFFFSSGGGVVRQRDIGRHGERRELQRVRLEKAGESNLREKSRGHPGRQRSGEGKYTPQGPHAPSGSAFFFCLSLSSSFRSFSVFSRPSSPLSSPLPLFASDNPRLPFPSRSPFAHPSRSLSCCRSRAQWRRRGRLRWSSRRCAAAAAFGWKLVWRRVVRRWGWWGLQARVRWAGRRRRKATQVLGPRSARYVYKRGTFCLIQRASHLCLSKNRVSSERDCQSAVLGSASKEKVDKREDETSFLSASRES